MILNSFCLCRKWYVYWHMCLWFLRTVILLLKVVEENFPGKNHFLLALLDLSKQRTSLKSKLASTYILLTNNLIISFNGCLKLTENGPAHPSMMEMIYGFSMNWISITFGNDLWLPSNIQWSDKIWSAKPNLCCHKIWLDLDWIGLTSEYGVSTIYWPFE